MPLESQASVLQDCELLNSIQNDLYALLDSALRHPLRSQGKHGQDVRVKFVDGLRFSSRRGGLGIHIL